MGLSGSTPAMRDAPCDATCDAIRDKVAAAIAARPWDADAIRGDVARRFLYTLGTIMRVHPVRTDGAGYRCSSFIDLTDLVSTPGLGIATAAALVKQIVLGEACTLAPAGSAAEPLDALRARTRGDVRAAFGRLAAVDTDAFRADVARAFLQKLAARGATDGSPTGGERFLGVALNLYEIHSGDRLDAPTMGEIARLVICGEARALAPPGYTARVTFNDSTYYLGVRVVFAPTE